MEMVRFVNGRIVSADPDMKVTRAAASVGAQSAHPAATSAAGTSAPPSIAATAAPTLTVFSQTRNASVVEELGQVCWQCSA
jgi:hypothetical protein